VAEGYGSGTVGTYGEKDAKDDMSMPLPVPVGGTMLPLGSVWTDAGVVASGARGMKRSGWIMGKGYSKRPNAALEIKGVLGNSKSGKRMAHSTTGRGAMGSVEVGIVSGMMGGRAGDVVLGMIVAAPIS
jgi:hypothetical protein